MRLQPHERLIALVNVTYIAIFTGVALTRSNFEFVLYAGVVIVLFLILLLKQHTIRFDRTILWGLTLWGLMHLAGGNIRVDPDVLYTLQLIPGLLRYDQLVHFFGFAVATLACHHLLRPYLRDNIARGASLYVLVILMGQGLGATNEIIEFAAVKTVPETGVGGYDNTLWDLVFNLLGACVAVIYLHVRADPPREVKTDDR